MSPSESREDGVMVLGTIQDKAYQAYQLHLGGESWIEVASRLGYESAKTAEVTARKYVQRAAMGMDMAKREEVLNTEMDRLDALQAAVWPTAMLGDTKAVDSVLKIMGHRAKLLGLDLVLAAGGTVNHNTVVVQGDTQEFIRSLKLVDGIEDDAEQA